MRFHILICLLFPLFAQAQDTIGGIVNVWAVVLDVDECTGRIGLADTAGFRPGTAALLIQMQGATIDESNGSSFGLVTDWGSTGLFERVLIDSVGADAVWVAHELLNDYQPVEGRVQLVSIPKYEGHVVVGDTLRARPWDGETGGVLALEVEGLLELWAPVDVSACGFRGGPRVAEPSQCLWLLQQDDWYYPMGSWRGAPKGEGIAAWIAGKEAGRGPQANGGGGGNDHNAGGGGGGHLTAGGQGGEEVPPSVFGCHGPYPGKGGRPLDGAPGLRLFMGGGGGAGHTEYLTASNPGGRGGGIIMLWADSLRTHGFRLSANGESLPVANGESGGGGGAGGTLWIDVDTALDTIHAEARGGDGGTVNNQTGRCAGPGGGGAGGRVLTNAPVLVDLAGGQNGVNLNPGPCDDPASQALPGAAGVLAPLPDLPEGSQPLADGLSWLLQPTDAIGCTGDTATFALAAAGPGIAYQWQVWDSTAGAWTPLSEMPPFVGVAGSQLVVAPLSDSLDGLLLRGVATSPCFDSIFTQPVALQVLSPPTLSFAWQSVADQVVQFAAEVSAYDSLWWDFGDGTGSSQPAPVHDFPAADSFLVTLTVWHPCGVYDTAAWVSAVSVPRAAFSMQPNQGCAPLEVHFFDMSGGVVQSWNWSFPGGVPAQSTEPDPVVIYAEPGTYDVSLEVTNAAGSHQTTVPAAVVVWPQPEATFDWQLDGLTLAVTATGAAQTFFWDFGDGTPGLFGASQSHTYAEPGLYYVSLLASNGGCSALHTVPVWIALTGVEEASPDACRLVPNPAREQVRLSCGVGGPVEVQVFHLSGRGLGVFRLSANEALDLRGWPAGLYFVRWRAAGRSGIERLVVP